MTLSTAPSVFEVDGLREVYSLPTGVVVSRLKADPLRAQCALCWVGPCAVAGFVRERAGADIASRPICSRCLVTLEMLAVQFGSDLRMQLETNP